MGTATPEPLTLRVPPEAAGERLDRWLSAQCPNLSRNQLAHLIESGALRLDGRAVKPGARLKGGETVAGAIRLPAAPGAPRPEAIPLRIVYEDADVLVVDKPAGLVVHPAPGHASGTLVNAVLGLRAADPEGDAGDAWSGGEPSQRPGIVHRLDRDTSGLLVVARNRASEAELQRQLAARTVLKQYLAVVRGHPASDRGAIDAPIGRDPRHRKRMAVVATGRPAVTRFTVLERLPGYSLVEATLETGRTHQLRVHFAAIGHPILGDPTYGVIDPKLGLERQFLHAHRLAFDLPATGQRATFTSDLPADLQRTLARLRGTPPVAQ